MLDIYEDVSQLKGVLTVDVGVNTAFAKWDGSYLPEVRSIKGGSTKNIEVYLSDMREKFSLELISFKYWESLKTVYIEGVQYLGDDLKSITSSRRGDLAVLSYLVGVYASQCMAFNIPVKILTASQWKGQLTKRATAERVYRINKQRYKNEHIRDAVGMGFSLVKKVWYLHG